MGWGANPTNYCHHQNEFCFEVRVKQTHSNGTDHCVMVCHSHSDSLFAKLYNKENVLKSGKHTDVSKQSRVCGENASLVCCKFKLVVIQSCQVMRNQA